MNKFIIDAHTHILLDKGIENSKNNIVDSMKKYNISYSLVSFDGSEYGKLGKLYTSIEGSNIALTFAKENPRNIGIAIWIKPHTEKEKSIDLLSQFIKTNRKYIHAIKFHPYLSKLKITSKLLIPYINLAKIYNLPILVHTAMDKYSSIIYLKEVCDLYPDITFIAAHAELGSDHKYTINLMRSTPNLYIDTAWVDPVIYKLIRKYNLVDRIIFGSDNPIDGMDTLNNQIYQKYLKRKFRIKDDEYDKLMYLNATKVYKIAIK